MEDTSHSLLERLASESDPADWNRMLAMYRPLLVGWLRSRVPQESDAEDLVQEIMIVVFEKVKTFQHSGSSGAFRAWLWSIMLHKVQGFWRKSASLPLTSSPQANVWRELEQNPSEVEKEWDREHDRFIINKMLDRIRPEFEPMTWQAFELYSIEGLPPSQVSQRLGCSTNVVFIARSRILHRLRIETRGLVSLADYFPQ